MADVCNARHFPGKIFSAFVPLQSGPGKLRICRVSVIQNLKCESDIYLDHIVFCITQQAFHGFILVGYRL